MDIKKAALNTSPCNLDRIGVYAALGFDPDCYPWDYPSEESILFLGDNMLDRYGVGVYGANEYRVIEIPDFLIDDAKTVERAFKALNDADEIKKHAKALYNIEYSREFCDAMTDYVNYDDFYDNSDWTPEADPTRIPLSYSTAETWDGDIEFQTQLYYDYVNNEYIYEYNGVIAATEPADYTDLIETLRGDFGDPFDVFYNMSTDKAYELEQAGLLEV